MYKNESDMYPHVKGWLEQLLNSKMKDADFISVYNTSKIKLMKLLVREGIHRYFSSEYVTYDIRVDITGITVKNDKGDLLFVECKLSKINLRDLSQLLGYSVVARPLYSIIVSPNGVSDSLFSLIKSFGRTDILRYYANRKIAIAKWDESKMDIDYMSIIPSGWSIK